MVYCPSYPLTDLILSFSSIACGIHTHPPPALEQSAIRDLLLGHEWRLNQCPAIDQSSLDIARGGEAAPLVSKMATSRKSWCEEGRIQSIEPCARFADRISLNGAKRTGFAQLCLLFHARPFAFITGRILYAYMFGIWSKTDLWLIFYAQ